MANKLRRRELENRETEKNQALADLLRKQKVKHVKAPKKKTPSELYSDLRCYLFSKYEVRPLEQYSVKSYNLERQQRDLIKHLYVKYPTPNFMYTAFFKTSRGYGYPGEFRVPGTFAFEWFFCIAQGGSFRKLVKDLMTSKEAVVFLNAPDHYTIENAFWYAKMRYLGISPRIIEKLIFDKGFFNNRAIAVQNVEHLNHVFQFYAKYHEEIDNNTFDEITDFIQAKIQEDRTFSLRGRTLNSVIALSNEWHALRVKAKLGSKVNWPGRGWKPWELDEKEIIWEVVELTTNHQLINEGRKQSHCVSGYWWSCANGSCNIFSLRRYNSQTLIEYEKNRITLELRGDRIVQARGFANRSPKDDEERVIRRFCTAKGLIYEKQRHW